MAIKRITTNLIKDSDIATVDIANNAITAAKITDGNITTAKLADLSVTAGKLAATLDLTGKTITVATATTGDNDTSPASTAFVQQEIAALVDSSPDSLNTLNELAAALGDDASFSTTVTNSIATKLPLAGGALTGNLSIGDSSSRSFALYIENAGSAGAGQLMLVDSDNDTLQREIRTDAGVLSFDYWDSSNRSNHLTILANGKVGINQSSPSKLLHVQSDTDYEGIIIKGAGHKQLTIESTSSSRQALTTFQTGSQNMSIGLDTDNAFIFHSGTAGSERMQIDSSGNLLVNQTSAGVNGKLQVTGGIGLTGNSEIRQSTNSDGSTLRFLGTQFVAGSSNAVGYSYSSGALIASVSNSANVLLFEAGASNTSGHRLTIQNDATGLQGEVKYAGSEPVFILRDTRNAGGTAWSDSANEPLGEIEFWTSDGTGIGPHAVARIRTVNDITAASPAGAITFMTSGYNNGSPTERMRISSSGEVLVGATSGDAWLATSGKYVQLGDTYPFAATNNSIVGILNRTGTDGTILEFKKDANVVGNINVEGSELAIGHTTAGLQFLGSEARIRPFNITNNAATDNTIDLGRSNSRFDDIYATNATINTSDRNEKQDIEALTDAETRVAVAAKGLLRKFRWQSAVASKGDEARIHFGIIAQDLQDAFTAEGLDAGDYAMFISDTWTDDDDGVEQTRLGVRYSELLAFIIAGI